jgi:hypothetical protein
MGKEAQTGPLAITSKSSFDLIVSMLDDDSYR